MEPCRGTGRLRGFVAQLAQAEQTQRRPIPLCGRNGADDSWIPHHTGHVYWAGPGGTYIVIYGLIAVGGLFALEGIYKTLTNADGVASFIRCFMAFAVVIAIVVVGGGLVFNKTVFASF